jgi:L,D-peptidoglycan transpeptidase YkuD (ErfK/YbiS/YcfS/YnhG family)
MILRAGHTAWIVATRTASMLAIAALIGACGSSPTRTARRFDPLAGARQLIMVVSEDWNAGSGELRAYERDAGDWRATGLVTPVALGRNGSGWGLGLHPPQSTGPLKQEGDGRAPAGVFRLGDAFGYAPDNATSMNYQAMEASDYCIDVPTSPLYNRLVDADDVGVAAVEGSTEPMRLDLHAGGDQRYRLGFVIGHNEAAIARGGSCIFAHLWRRPGEPTAGCTSMDGAAMQALLAWLRPDRQPRFVLLPRAEFDRLQNAWQLPPAE